MDFKEATDRLMAAGVSTSDIAAVLGVTQSTVLRARMDQSNKNSRPAPDGWRPVLRELARVRSEERCQNSMDLTSLADALDP